MHRATTLVVLLMATALAGCSDGGKTAGPDIPDPAFDEFDAEATATTGLIRGIVVDDAIRPLAGANVSITALQRSQTTTDTGLFVFDDLEPGTYFLEVAKAGYNSTQVAAEVKAGVQEPDIVKVLLQVNPGTAPYVEEYALQAFITCGVAVVASSVGCATVNVMADAIGDRVYFPFRFDVLPMWVQGELVWQQTQAAGGQAIWQIAGCPTGDPNPYCDAPPAMASPALAFVTDEKLAEHADSILDPDGGIQYNIFGGPHPACSGVGYGCGLTVNQAFDVYIHHFFNFKPEEGWRFTTNGSPKLP